MIAQILLILATTSFPPDPNQTVLVQSPKHAETLKSLGTPMVKTVPIWPQVILPGFSITNFSINAGNASIGWNGSSPPFQVQGTMRLPNPQWIPIGNLTMARTKTFPVDSFRFWRVEGSLLAPFTANPTNQPRLTWSNPDLEMSDSIATVEIYKNVAGYVPPSPDDPADFNSARWSLLKTISPVSLTSTTDSTVPPAGGLWYKMNMLTANGYRIPHQEPALTNQSTGTVIRAVGFHSTLAAVGKLIKVLPDSSYIVVGYFKGTANFGGSDLTSSPGSYSLFIAKYSSGGSHVWSKSYGGAGDITPNFIAVDSSGNVFLCGVFTGTGNFGGSSFTTQSTGAWHAKYTSSGNHVWSNGYVIADISRFCSFEQCGLDSLGNMFVIGYFLGQGASFGGPVIPVNQQFEQTVLAKYDASNGAFIWNITFPGSVFGPFNHGLSIAIDTSNNVYIGGNFYYSVDCAYNNPGNDGSHTIYTSNLTYKQAYVAKFDNNGIHQWSFRRGGDTPNTTPGPATKSNPPPTSSECYALSLDGLGNLYGGFLVSGQTDLGAGVNMFASQLNNVGVAKYRASDGAYVGGSSWQSMFVITGDSGGAIRLTCDKNANPVVSFFFAAGSEAGVTLPNGTILYGSGLDGLICKLSAGNGSVLWYNQVAGFGSDGVAMTSTDPNSGNTLATGNFSAGGTTRFGTGGVTLTPQGSFSNIFVIEITP